MVSAPLADWMRKMHPLRLQYELFSDANPLMGSVAMLAGQVRRNRKPMTGENPFTVAQENLSNQIVTALDAWRVAAEKLSEQTFLAVYGAPTLQAALGVDPAANGRLRMATKSPLHRELLEKKIAELKSRIAVGGVREAVIRGVLYAGMGRAAVDERGFELARQIRKAHGDLPVSEFKALVREQFAILLVDEKAALAAIPSMLPADAETKEKAYGLIKEVLGARGELSAEDNKRMGEIARLFGVDGGTARGHLREVPKKPQAKAS
jgi:hypothetical protein